MGPNSANTRTPPERCDCSRRGLGNPRDETQQSRAPIAQHLRSEDVSWGARMGALNNLAPGLNETVSGAFTIRTHAARGRFLSEEPVAMRRPAQVPLDGMGFPLTLAGALRSVFAHVVSIPIPGRLAALMRQLSANRDERLGGEPDHGADATQAANRIDCRGRR
jgi:hypothetical protein